MNQYQHHHHNGQSLIEVIIAATVGILVVSALTFTTIFSLRNANFAKTSSQATKLAQEGIERVRTGRDRNSAIINLQIGADIIDSWNGTSRGTRAFWDNRINDTCIPNCYFNVAADGSLQYLDSAAAVPPAAETVGQFKRVVILSDDATNPNTQKKVTVIVTWTDFTGPHESRLVTILGKI
ncbi:hypothetical protein A3J19_01800 [Candidatus Daviesbacteria bacterium RIFCSPLOWO2_02_FULL_41_8]|uniref:Type II secretion system protein n=3 Tax=Candidatus Daviesiibacteriota TaxID=1752718 RepID=A0A1F5NHY8_9BACT|nr:MAG: hypothetical protein A2871_00945 [Candidatus Daviesbacteria bacterium RIFCSPHIGHO2_01_FULL_41_23]OGE32959.1 MAG: hypothetical protein A3D83_04820 [Candidatus Daviesbacteria bacterium RIFCSPHIGHO2_02_FULL_41_10]OGE62461.1 MAG: hypothetical protein A2967_01430 [Candidatus Daviesbacteria bacterium RIFCSPLOWO2_01_FULL_41_32]OGE77193.1 MAG: hypothetical protein A3J19_01800 [Candidatus Daviesbacteria bacterium RIFCSPLOWO2_02_FULL_41_8]